MSHARTVSCSLLAPLVLALPLLSSSSPSSTVEGDLAELVVFGASMADAGSVSILTDGFLPGPLYWQGRLTNGPNWVDQLAVLLGLPVAESYLIEGGTNYAVGGAGAGVGFSNACFGNVCAPNIGLQIEYYLAGSPVLDGDELFVLQGGGNDFRIFTGLHNATMTAYNMRVRIETLAEAGARNFAVVNLGPDILSPIEYLVSNNVWIQCFNAMLEAHLHELESELGLNIALVDWHALKSAMIEDPGAFGLTNLTDPACPQCAGGSGPNVSNPEQYFLWDGVHPTTTVQAFLAEVAADAVTVELGL